MQTCSIAAARTLVPMRHGAWHQHSRQGTHDAWTLLKGRRRKPKKATQVVESSSPAVWLSGVGAEGR
jgi:hypothetical protein